MKLAKLIFALICLLASLAGQNAWADRGHFRHGHAHVGVFIGAPFGWPGWYGPAYPYYYAPYQPIVVERAPTEYVERSQPQEPGSPASNYWYYCQSPDGYYPHVKECPGGWERVTPQPPAPPR